MISNEKSTVTIKQLLAMIAACAVGLSVWRITERNLYAVWAVFSCLFLFRVMTPSTGGLRSIGIARWLTMLLMLGAWLVAMIDLAATPLVNAGLLETNWLSGFEWTFMQSEPALFLILFLMIAHSAVPAPAESRLGEQQKQHQRGWRYLRVAWCIFVGLAAVALLVALAIDVSCILTLSDLGIERVRAEIVDSALPELTLDPTLPPRTELETNTALVVSLLTGLLAITGLMMMSMRRTPRRRIAVALTLPAVAWMLWIIVGPGFRLSPFLFQSILQTHQPFSALVWFSACGIAAYRLASRTVDLASRTVDLASQTGDDGHAIHPKQKPAGPLWDLSVFCAACYTIYETDLRQSLLDWELTLGDFASWPAVQITAIAAIVAFRSLQNLACRVVGVRLVVPEPKSSRDVFILWIQLVVIGPIVVLTGSGYWIFTVG